MTRATTAGPRRDAELVGRCRELPVDPGYLRGVVETLGGIGSSPIGYRTTGTPEDERVAAYVAAQMREIGLVDVAVERVPVDSWRFLSAAVGVPDGPSYAASSFGGVPGTPAEGLLAPLVDVGTGLRRRLDRLDVSGCIALLDWASISASPSAVALELGRRGAVGVVLSCSAGGPYFQEPGALGAFDAQWHPEAPPMVLVSTAAAAELRETRPPQLRLSLVVERRQDARGCSVVGYLRGDEPGPLVVGAHHDGWFSAAFDNATGVAAMLGIARALAATGHRPRHDLCFTSRSGEEWGLDGSDYDWCIGAWQQVTTSHPEWAEQAPFHLCLEASGLPGLRVVVETPVELAAWSRRMCRLAAREGWLPDGWRLGPPVTGTEQWPLLVAGIPGVAAYTWETSFARTAYHSQLDTADRLDDDRLVRLSRFYALLLLSADADPDAALDHAARTRELSRVASGLGEQGEALAAAVRARAAATAVTGTAETATAEIAGGSAGRTATAETAGGIAGRTASGRTAAGRAAFSVVGRELCAVDARGATGYPHEQSARDVAALEAGIEALARGDRRAAVRALSRVGDNAQTRYLSREAFAAYTGRRSVGTGSWAGRSHLTACADLWEELASLRGEPEAREPGRWLDVSLREHLSTAQATLAQRLAAMARAVRG